MPEGNNLGLGLHIRTNSQQRSNTVTLTTLTHSLTN